MTDCDCEGTRAFHPVARHKTMTDRASAEGLLDADRHLPDCDAPGPDEPCTCVSRAEARASAEELRAAAQRLSDHLFEIYDQHIDREYPWEADWKALRAALRDTEPRPDSGISRSVIRRQNVMAGREMNKGIAGLRPDSDPCPVCRVTHWPWHAHAEGLPLREGHVVVTLPSGEQYYDPPIATLSLYEQGRRQTLMDLGFDIDGIDTATAVEAARGLREPTCTCAADHLPGCAMLGGPRPDSGIDVDRASAEGLLSRDNPRSRWHAEQVTPDYRQSWSCIPLTDAVEAVALRDTGSRPDSGGDIDALLAEADRRVTALQYDVKNARMRQGIGMGADIYRDVIARLSTPRTETSDA